MSPYPESTPWGAVPDVGVPLLDYHDYHIVIILTRYRVVEENKYYEIILVCSRSHIVIVFTSQA